MGPNFIVVGAAKAGTTWLYNCFKEHPDVFVPTPKELHFFSRVVNYKKGIDWYYSFFIKNNKAVAVDVCPSYIFVPEVPSRIYAWNPEIKLIFILRNPLERAYSSYCMKLDHGDASRNIEQELSLQSFYVKRGLYYQQIKEYLKFFPREKLKVLIFDDLKHDPELFLREIYTYLGVDEDFKPGILNRKENARKPPPRFMQLYNPLREAYMSVVRQKPEVEVFVQKLRRKGYLAPFDAVMRGGQYPKLTREIEFSLANFFREDVRQLSEFLDRDLSHWIEPLMH